MSALRRRPAEPKQERSVATRLKLLDAAVDELVDHGYARLTTSAVAHRAGVSRGAQERYFPHKNVLVTEAIRHLSRLQLAELKERIVAVPRGPARVQRALDVVYELYSGRLFLAAIEVSLAARDEPELAPVMTDEEQSIGRALRDSATVLLGQELTRRGDFGARWATALATARGLAMLRLLGHPADVVDSQWSFARTMLLRMLVDDQAT